MRNTLLALSAAAVLAVSTESGKPTDVAQAVANSVSDVSPELSHAGVQGASKPVPSEVKLIVEWASDAPSMVLRRTRLQEIESEASASEYFSMLPSRQPEGAYGSPSEGGAFSMYTIRSLVQKHFNGRVFDRTQAADVPELQAISLGDGDSHGRYGSSAPAAAAVASVERLNALGVDILIAHSVQDAADLFAALQASPLVAHVERDVETHIFRPADHSTLAEEDGERLAGENLSAEAAQALPNDAHFRLLWGMHDTSGGDKDVNGPEIWAALEPSGSRWRADPVVVGVVDTGSWLQHEDLRDQLWTNPGEIPGNGRDDDGNGYVDDVHGYDFINGDANPQDDNMHGSHCAGTILGTGDNGRGVAGVFWGAKLMSLKTMNAKGSGSYAASISALNYAAAMGAHVTNNSWGGPSASSSLRNALRNAPILHVAAAGNDASNNDRYAQYPSQYTMDLDNVISIAATQRSGALANFSNYGASSVDVAAPGVDIASTCLNGSYCYASGTSMATPHVAGVAAALVARGREMAVAAGQSSARVGPFPADLKKILKDTAKPVGALQGRLNVAGTVDGLAALRALEALMNSRLGSNPDPAPTPAPPKEEDTTTTSTTTRATTTTTTTRRTTTTTRAASTCQIGRWSSWGECNAKCGLGRQKRTRTVSGPCPAGTATEESAYCFAGLCNNWWDNLFPFGHQEAQAAGVDADRA